MTDPILNFIQTRIEKGRELYHKTKQTLERWLNAVIQKTLYPFRLVNNKIIKPIQFFLKKISQPIQSAKEITSNLLDKVKEAHQKFREALLNLPNKIEETFRKAPDVIKAFLSRITTTLNPIASFLKRADSRLSEFFDKATQVKNTLMDRFIYQPAKAIDERYQSLKNWMIEKSKSVTEPIVNWTQPKIEKLTDIATRINERLNNSKEKISSKIQDFTEVVKNYTSDISSIKQILPEPVIAFFAPLVTATQRAINAPLGLFKQGSHSRKRLKKLQKKIKAHLASFNQRFIKFLWDTAAKTKPKLISSAKAFVSITNGTLRILLEMLKEAFYMLRMIFTWFKILLKHGMLLVRETCSNWFPNLKFNK